MSELLDALIAQRKKEALDYQKYLTNIVELAKKVTNPTAGSTYPAALDTAAKRALYDNLDKNEALALTVDRAVRESRQDDWRSNPIKVKKVKLAFKAVLHDDEALTNQILDLVKSQHEY